MYGIFHTLVGRVGLKKSFSKIKINSLKSNLQPCIGEYSAKKIYFFPGHQKNCSKVSPYFSLFEEENCRNLHFFGKKIVKISFFWEKLSKFALFGVNIAKICKIRGKNLKKLHFLG